MLASLAHSKYRKEHRLFLVEGVHAARELLRSRWPVKSVIIADTFSDRDIIEKAEKYGLERVGIRTIQKIATTKTPQDIIAVAAIPENNPGKLTSHNKVLIADGVKDPGNLGTIIRTAEALGFGAVVTTAGSVDVFNPKVVRATQGAMFFIDIAQRVAVGDIINRLRSSHTIYALAVEGDSDLSSAAIDEKAALVIGSETRGVCDELLTASRHRVRIPLPGKSESLNAAVAAGIAMYLFGRR